jgi:hypothetical protein
MEETSQKQIDANRENGKLGGVKTAEGKAVSRYNAIKHGILCQEILLKNEDESALVELGKQLRQELKPMSEMELILVDRIIANTWRLKRALRGEKEMTESRMANAFLLSLSEKEKNLGEVLMDDFRGGDSYLKFTRYEMSLERGVYKALHELQRLQAARSGEKPPLPVAVDIDVNTENLEV